MNHREALAKAQRLWGKDADIEDLCEKAPADGDGDIVWYRVGVQAIDGEELTFFVHGEGVSWEAAFADAEQNGWAA